ncbi:hypothetical protein FisN_2Lh375 [Fistulifera solaris]|uniref:SET domain-containing protein n=1 Tax=Fistulifera solaris TaxID=1519565 RepID=A0A1Z5JPJ9_FISSO|nr:hypothetical protein FisN_2Lh375 [Fistulifera solaris]|eukprot:GAX15889.1 hypothetical protein FisN_2Lh375 [Fistulifera solaris]
MRCKDSEVCDALCFNEATRELYADSFITEGFILMRLSKQVIISRQYLVPDCFIEIARGAIKDNTSSQQQAEHQEDIALALYLANREEAIKPYLDILPSCIDQNLPVTWTLEERAPRLCGSPVLKEIELRERKNFEDYKNISDFLACNEHLLKCPSKEAFDNALAWVRSRAFGMDGALRTNSGDAVPAMMPLLDLCNHARGRTVSKNISYSYEEGCVVVKALRDISPGEVLRITYGALPNSLLLMNYGFCLEENYEPDGSSNDILAFEPIAGGALVIDLRTGPKSYTYGKLVQALECYLAHSEEDHRETAIEEESESDSCHLLEDNEEDLDGSMLYAACGDDYRCSSACDNDLSLECEALRNLETRLLSLLRNYKLGEIKQVTDIDSQLAANTRNRFSSILTRSEMRTISFFLQVARRILSMLRFKRDHLQYNPCALSSNLDCINLKKQMEDLVDVYMRIRHPDISLRR